MLMEKAVLAGWAEEEGDIQGHFLESFQSPQKLLMERRGQAVAEVMEGKARPAAFSFTIKEAIWLTIFTNPDIRRRRSTTR